MGYEIEQDECELDSFSKDITILSTIYNRCWGLNCQCFEMMSILDRLNIVNDFSSLYPGSE